MAHSNEIALVVLSTLFFTERCSTARGNHF